MYFQRDLVITPSTQNISWYLVPPRLAEAGWKVRLALCAHAQPAARSPLSTSRRDAVCTFSWHRYRSALGSTLDLKRRTPSTTRHLELFVALWEQVDMHMGDLAAHNTLTGRRGQENRWYVSIRTPPAMIRTTFERSQRAALPRQARRVANVKKRDLDFSRPLVRARESCLKASAHAHAHAYCGRCVRLE